ncbi:MULTISPECIES: hypothetical protein [unclassified Dietzia]|uniref:hypothetical protein n=1 Tax=unclassified Dietzia TaxID=2617939 RepID=UPI0015FC1ADC|nr:MULTISPECIES: hypothetical protein [unclassified Dietzia]MBB1023325.1 hypothetical protein [Dietzia sp. DQ12-76]MBB1026496.1 hypothetical protein [Dietzia sp. DQ11-38-2]
MVNPLDRCAATEPELSDEELDAAREWLYDDWASRGWSREDAAKHIDDQLAIEQADYLRNHPTT